MDATFKLENLVFNYRVAGVLMMNNHVLIHKQVNDTHWALPGGRVEVLEDSKTGIVREISEELDMDVTVERLLWFTENFFDHKCRIFHEIGLYYLLNVDSSHFKCGPFYGEEDEHLIYEWVPISDLEQINLYPLFLREGLKKLPNHLEHIITHDERKY